MQLFAFMNAYLLFFACELNMHSLFKYSIDWNALCVHESIIMIRAHARINLFFNALRGLSEGPHGGLLQRAVIECLCALAPAHVGKH